MTIRTIACYLGITLAAVYVGASMRTEARSIIKAHRSPSHGAIELGNLHERSVIDGCIRWIGPSDLVAILYNESDPAPEGSPLFLTYRLAYRMYPTRLESAAMGEVGISAALAHLPRKPDWVLLLGQNTNVPGYEEIARFPPNDLLLRSTVQQTGEQPGKAR